MLSSDWIGLDWIGLVFFFCSCLDEMLPVFMFVVIRAKLPQLHSDCHMLVDFLSEQHIIGEAGMMVRYIPPSIATTFISLPLPLSVANIGRFLSTHCIIRLAPILRCDVHHQRSCADQQINGIWTTTLKTFTEQDIWSTFVIFSVSDMNPFSTVCSCFANCWAAVQLKMSG